MLCQIYDDDDFVDLKIKSSDFISITRTPEEFEANASVRLVLKPCVKLLKILIHIKNMSARTCMTFSSRTGEKIIFWRTP
ncbi:CLUMA_CG015970, isoform A [Clunio marinus]|uniref:CLUMA_CG015970, isoform A n=1 Tax=Clunio marinus TaxID=568069 RepID=A0A1J1IQX2_9DIPT|nr:CLUMA_CG015970, isoform A [Clunio marinus]